MKVEDKCSGQGGSVASSSLSLGLLGPCVEEPRPPANKPASGSRASAPGSLRLCNPREGGCELEAPAECWPHRNHVCVCACVHV
jgi:hypothetical protein